MRAQDRKLVGGVSLVLGLAAYAVAVASLSDWIGRLPGLVQAVLYLVLGIAWVFPLRPLIRWMETGRWRAEPGGR